MPPDKKHATLGASGAHRWMKCPGSVEMERGLSDETTIHAAEGTVAHDLAEQILTNVNRLWEPGQVIEQDGFEIEVTEDMHNHVRMYTNYCEELKNQPYLDYGVEQRLSLEALDPPDAMFGTGDFVAAYRDHHEGESFHVLEVVDLKYGRGVVVETKDNPQLRYYALGAVLAFNVKPDVIRTTVIQPRAHHPDGPIRSVELTWDELKAFKDELFEAAHAAAGAREVVSDATERDTVLTVLNPGGHCRWCKALATCPAQQEQALEVAQSEFNDEFAPPAPSALTREEITKVLTVAGQLKKWLGEIAEYARAEIEAGRPIPGYKLVEGRRGNRRWADTDAADTYLRGQGLRVDTRYKTRQLLTPTQAGKALKDHNGKELPDRLITQSDGKPNLASADDPRPALTSGDEFDVVDVED